MIITRELVVAIRGLRRRPSFAATATVTLALGIGANVAVFSAVRAVLIDELPYEDAASLVMLLPADHFRGLPATASDVEALGRLAAFQGVAGCTRAEATALRDRPTVLTAPLEVTPGFFGLWGVAPRLGRALTAEDFSPGARNAVVSFDFWRTRLAGDPQSIGKTVILNRRAWTIVGVMPPGFAPPCYDTGGASRAWIPHVPAAGDHSLTVVARLESGVEMSVAQSQVDALMSGLARDRADRRYENAYLEPLGASAAADLEPGLYLLQGMALLLLLITCANLGNLFLVRLTTRRGEFAVRAGLGARPTDLLRHVLTEAVVVASSGAALGVAAACATSAWLRSIAAPVLPEWLSLRIDAIDLAVGLGAGSITALLFGSIPALLSVHISAPRMTRSNPAQVTGGRVIGRLREGLVGAQVLLAVVLLAVAGLLIRSFVNVMSVPVGFEARGLVTTDLYLSAGASDADLESRLRRTIRRLEEEVGRANPSWAMSFADTSPFVSGGGVRWPMRLPHASEFVRRSFHAKRVSPNYLEVMRIPLVRGRSLSTVDPLGSARPAVVSAAFARTLGQGREVIGGELRSGDTTYVIVGVAGDVKSVWLSQPSSAEVYVPIESIVGNSLSVVVRSDSERRAIVALQGAASRVNPDGPPVAVESMASIVVRSEERRWFYSVLVSLFAGLSGVVAAAGVYGAVAEIVTQRAREMGIRAALGAGPRAVVALVMRQALRPAAIGVFGGALCAWWMAGVLQSNALFRSLMFQVAPADAWTLGLVSVAVLAMSILASWTPARSAARSDPATVLRES